MFDIVIIGGGVIGAFIARELSKLDASICVLEKEHDIANAASGANSGIVHAGFDAENGTLKARFNLLGNEMMPKVAKDLGVSFKQNGSCVIGFSDKDMKSIKILYERGLKNGVKKLEILTREELLSLEPNISKEAIGALFAPTSGIICPYGLTIAAMGNALDNGAVLKTDFEVKSIVENDNNYLISNGTEFVESNYIVNAAGTGSAKIANFIGDNSFNITPRKGEYMLLDKECRNIVTHTIFTTPSKMGKGILVSQTADENLILGPTSENIENDDDKSTTILGLQKIILGATREVPPVSLRNVITSFAGVRAVGSTGDYIINSPCKNFINCAGIDSPGLSSAPAIGEYIVIMLKNMGFCAKEKSNFNPTRKPMHYFHDLSFSEKTAFIMKNPSYGKIICRCEGISEGEILEALRQNPKTDTLDGVKRRTRAGMGRCQGGFCSPHVVEIISNELNIPFEKVTKNGGNSYINIARTKG